MGKSVNAAPCRELLAVQSWQDMCDEWEKGVVRRHRAAVAPLSNVMTPGTVCMVAKVQEPGFILMFHLASSGGSKPAQGKHTVMQII